MSLGPIPWTAADRWARRNRVLARERFHYLIQKLDTAFLKQMQPRDEKPKGKGPKRG